MDRGKAKCDCGSGRRPYPVVILVDQRGTGRSEPQLCPELTTKMLEADIAAVADMTEDNLARNRAMYLACRDAATGRGIDHHLVAGSPAGVGARRGWESAHAAPP